MVVLVECCDYKMNENLLKILKSFFIVKVLECWFLFLYCGWIFILAFKLCITGGAKALLRICVYSCF